MQQNVKNRISKIIYFLFDKNKLILFISIPFILFHILVFLVYYHDSKLKYINLFLMLLTLVSVIYFIYHIELVVQPYWIYFLGG